jgi:hypothetical protein
VAGEEISSTPPLNVLRLESGAYDFFDFGCSDGGMMQYVKSFWPSLRGCGFDIATSKIELARAAGHEAFAQDILELPASKLVRFVTLSHFLEHLDGLHHAKAMIEKAIDVSRGFILIKQPWFDSDAFLMLHDQKFFWSDWSGHTNPMTVLSFQRILRDEMLEGRIVSYSLFGRAAVRSSADRAILPLSAREDQHHFDEGRHGSKDLSVAFPQHTYREVVAIANISSDPLSEELISRLGQTVLLKHESVTR